MRVRGLYAIADSTFNPFSTLPELVECFLRGGAPIVQLRMKDAPEEAWAVAQEIMRLKDQYSFTFIVNDHVEVAIEGGADGVHVGSNDMSLTEVRRRVPDNMIVGYSSHSLEEARAAADAGADYVAFGAIYETKTKGPGHPVQGIEALRQVVDALDVPVVAIGGITRENVDEVGATGASSVAMITSLCQAPSVSEETRWFVDRIRKI